MTDDVFITTGDGTPLTWMDTQKYYRLQLQGYSQLVTRLFNAQGWMCDITECVVTKDEANWGWGEIVVALSLRYSRKDKSTGVRKTFPIRLIFSERQLEFARRIVAECVYRHGIPYSDELESQVIQETAMTNTSPVIDRLRDAAKTGTYTTHLRVSMGALDTVRALPGFASVPDLPGMRVSNPARIGVLELDGNQYGVFRDPTLADGFVCLADDDAMYTVTVWVEDGAMPEPVYYGTPIHVPLQEVFKQHDLAAVRADLERRYPGCAFTDAFVEAYANGSA